MTDKPKLSRMARKKLTKPRGDHTGQRDRTQRYKKQLASMNVHTPRNSRSGLSKKDVDTIKHLKASLRETWQGMWDRVNDFTHFTQQQMEFARQYAINGRRNKTEAARLAGYAPGNPDKQHESAQRNLRRPFMEDLISLYELEEKAKMRINVEDVVKWFNDIATKAMQSEDFTNANRAMENLAKYLGMFVERKEITHKTIHSREELDARIAELTAVLKEAEPDIARKLRIN